MVAAGVAEGGELVVKDLGPQISWTTVFVIEYVREFLKAVTLVDTNDEQIGPLIIHPLVYNFPRIFYGGPVQHSMLQKCVPVTGVNCYSADVCAGLCSHK